jgi:hypothetical protein
MNYDRCFPKNVPQADGMICRQQKAEIRQQLKADFFAGNRLINFLRKFQGSDIFNVKILKNDSDFFTLGEIFCSEINKRYPVSREV